MSSLAPMPFDSKLMEVPVLLDEAVLDVTNAIQEAVERLSTKERCLALLHILGSLDLTILNATDSEDDVTALIDRAVQPLRDIFPSDWRRAKKCAAVCFYPTLVSHAVQYRKQQYPEVGVKLATVAGGFPSGQYMLETKMLEVQLAVDDGADEVDVVINRAQALNYRWQTVYDEVANMKGKCLPAAVRMKTILAVGELDSLYTVYKASMVAMMAGSDFIKTSTGKEKLNANLTHSYVMCLAINQFYQTTGRRVGFKAAGGISTVDQALCYMLLVKRVLGDHWLNEDLFRIGASSLLVAIVDYLKVHSTEVNLKQLLDN